MEVDVPSVGAASPTMLKDSKWHVASKNFCRLFMMDSGTTSDIPFQETVFDGALRDSEKSERKARLPSRDKLAALARTATRKILGQRVDRRATRQTRTSAAC